VFGAPKKKIEISLGAEAQTVKKKKPATKRSQRKKPVKKKKITQRFARGLQTKGLHR